MRLQTDQASSSSTSLAVPSNSLAASSIPVQSSNPLSSNGHTNGVGPTANGFSNGLTNGTGSSNSTSGPLKNGVGKHGKSVAQVSLPGRKLFPDSNVDREEFVRLVVQSLRDVGYMYAPFLYLLRATRHAIADRRYSESAVTLEAESGYAMESQEVAEFRHHVLEASWEQAEAALVRLGVTDEDNLMVRFAVSDSFCCGSTQLLANRSRGSLSANRSIWSCWRPEIRLRL